MNKLQFEKKSFDDFMALWKKNESKHTLRLGQALYDHFKLYRLVNQHQLNHIYEKDGKEAINCFHSFAELV